MSAGRLGTVFLVGAGPGDAELITVRGRRLVESAEVIVHDRLGTSELLRLAPRECVLVDAGKAPGRHGMGQEEITSLLIGLARDGRDVVRLKGGDPFVFGRGGDEALALTQAGVSWEVVPGVTSAVGVPASVGVPVTHRGLARSVTVASGHDDPHSPAAQERWRTLAAVPGTLVLLMAMGNLDGIARALIDGGRPPGEPAMAVQDGTTSRERMVAATLATIAARCREADLRSPAVVVIGPVAALGGGDEGMARQTAADDQALPGCRGGEG